MASIWKELLFLHGHFVRAEDLAGPVRPELRPQPGESEPENAPRAAARPAPELAGGCA
ncbi:hypothetical protein [Tahibacter harae]|uniref:Uncharacterized protein n=1 Tax=Tahibacter harae TaxID=2963937 RepID=A0ABT1QTJ7_9GAMM|nr:hypothetical protein [Tahibacter harae]MCQ4165602.1 hypothetical protein [Tahibacter harae]